MDLQLLANWYNNRIFGIRETAHVCAVAMRPLTIKMENFRFLYTE